MRLIKKNKKINSNPFVIQPGKIKDRKLEVGYKANWTEEIFETGQENKLTISKTFDLAKLPKLSLVLFLFLAVIFFRATWLQLARGDYFYHLAEGNRIRVERIESKRGIIYDQRLEPLVRNLANFLLYLVPADLPKEPSQYQPIINRISQIIENVKAEEIERMLEKIKTSSLESYQPLFVADKIPYEKAMLLYLESAQMPGVILASKVQREYNLCDYANCPASLSHLLGYTGKINEEELKKFGADYLAIDYLGKAGVENFWENELRGVYGKKQIEVDAFGKEKKIINQQPPVDGDNLVLSLNLAAQQKLEELLANSLAKLKLTKACAIVLNPENGEVIAMISLPAYNNNFFARGITNEEYQELINHPDLPLFNRCISGEYASGSTIKPVIAAAGLEEGVIDENTTFNSTGGLKVGEWFFPDWRAGGHGLTNVRQALAESVNTFFYYLGGGYGDFTGLGIDRLVKYAKLFNLGAQTGVDLIGEADGFLPSKEWKESTKGERWYIGDTYHFAIGQGDILVTPLQVANYTVAFANGGSLYRPHFTRQILDSQNKVISQIETKPTRNNFIKQNNIKIVRQGMRQTVTSGSAKILQTLPVAVAGKTGTAQWSTTKNAHAWFTGFAPYEQPEIVLTILIEEGGEGSQVAVPIAYDFFNWYFSQKR